MASVCPAKTLALLLTCLHARTHTCIFVHTCTCDQTFTLLRCYFLMYKSGCFGLKISEIVLLKKPQAKRGSNISSCIHTNWYVILQNPLGWFKVSCWRFCHGWATLSSCRVRVKSAHSIFFVVILLKSGKSPTKICLLYLFEVCLKAWYM